MDPEPQELFLLEFLVNHVNIPSVQAMQDDILQVKTCIEFRILNLPPLYVCQDAPCEKCACMGPEAQVFRKGKSCLFALSCRLLQKPICSFPVIMSVYKKLPPTILPDVMTIGCCNIELRDMINALLDDCVEDCPAPCKTMKNNFRISTATGQCVGEVGTFIRFSRFGRKIVTQFQMPHNKKPYLFKGLEESPVFQCRKVPSTYEDIDQYTQHNHKVEKTCRPKKECPPPPEDEQQYVANPCCEQNKQPEKCKKKKSRCNKNKNKPKPCSPPPCGNQGFAFTSSLQCEKQTRACGCDK